MTNAPIKGEISNSYSNNNNKLIYDAYHPYNSKFYKNRLMNQSQKVNNPNYYNDVANTNPNNSESIQNFYNHPSYPNNRQYSQQLSQYEQTSLNNSDEEENDLNNKDDKQSSNYGGHTLLAMNNNITNTDNQSSNVVSSSENINNESIADEDDDDDNINSRLNSNTLSSQDLYRYIYNY